MRRSCSSQKKGGKSLDRCQSAAISEVAVGDIQAEIALHMQTPYLRVELQGMPTSYQTLQQTRGNVLHPGKISPISFQTHPTRRPAECGRH